MPTRSMCSTSPGASPASATRTRHGWSRSPSATARQADDEPDRLHAELFSGSRGGPLGLLRDLHDLYLMAALCDVAWMLVGQAAQVHATRQLLAVVTDCEGEAETQLRWLRTRMKQAAPQALVVT